MWAQAVRAAGQGTGPTAGEEVCANMDTACAPDGVQAPAHAGPTLAGPGSFSLMQELLGGSSPVWSLSSLPEAKASPGHDSGDADVSLSGHTWGGPAPSHEQPPWPEPGQQLRLHQQGRLPGQHSQLQAPGEAMVEDSSIADEPMLPNEAPTAGANRQDGAHRDGWLGSTSDAMRGPLNGDVAMASASFPDQSSGWLGSRQGPDAVLAAQPLQGQVRGGAVGQGHAQEQHAQGQGADREIVLDLEPCLPGCACLLCQLSSPEEQGHSKRLRLAPEGLQRATEVQQQRGMAAMATLPVQMAQGGQPHEQGRGPGHQSAERMDGETAMGVAPLFRGSSTDAGQTVVLARTAPRPAGSLAARLASLVQGGAGRGAKAIGTGALGKRSIAALGSPDTGVGDLEPPSSSSSGGSGRTAAKDEAVSVAAGPSGLTPFDSLSSENMPEDVSSPASSALIVPRAVGSGPAELVELSSLDDLAWLSDISIDLAPGVPPLSGMPLTSSMPSLSSSPSQSAMARPPGSTGKLRALLCEMDEGAGRTVLRECLGVGTSVSDQDQSMALTAVTRARAVADSDEGSTELRLKKRLLALAEALATNDEMQESIFFRLLEADMSPEGTPMQRVAYYFVNALKLRKKGNLDAVCQHGPYDVDEQVGLAVTQFNAMVPYVEFWALGMACAILDVATGSSRIHIVDFGLWPRMWAFFFRQLRALASAENASHTGGSVNAMAPNKRCIRVRYTVVVLPQDSPRGTGPYIEPHELKALLMFAATEAGVELEFRAIESSLQGFRPSMVLGESKVGKSGGGEGEDMSGDDAAEDEKEVLAICLSTHFETLADSSVLRSNPRNQFIQTLASMKPDIITMGTMEADFNMPFFLKRFRATLEIYSRLFQSFDLGAPRSSFARRMFEEKIMARAVTNLVACDGAYLNVRCEGSRKIHKRLRHLGLEPIPQSAYAAEQLRLMLKRFPPEFSIRPAFKGGGGILVYDGTDMNCYSAWRPIRPADDEDADW